MKCDSCSADISPDSLRCEFCGSHVHPAPPVASHSTRPTRAEIFAKIKSSSQYRAATAGPGSVPFPMYAQTGFLMLFCIVTFGITIVFAFFAGPMCIVPLGMSIFAGFMLAKSGAKLHSFTTSPTVKIPVIVVAKRVEMHGEHNNLAAYYTTFEYENGDREEIHLWEQTLFGQLADEDAGVLFRRGEIAVDFRRIPL